MHSPRTAARRIRRTVASHRRFGIAAVAIASLWLADDRSLSGAFGVSDAVESPAADAAPVTVVLMAEADVKLRSEVAAKVTAVHVRFGQAFEAGQVLMELDDAVFRVAFEAAEARCQWARARLEEVEALAADRTAERRAEAIEHAAAARREAMEKLYDDGHASQTQRAEADRDLIVARADRAAVVASRQAQLAEARRELAVARMQLTAAEQQLTACRIVAPFDGRVVSVEADPHELIEPGAALMHIIHDRRLQARFLLPARRFGEIRVGAECTVRLDHGASVAATIRQVAATIDPASATFEVRAEIDNARGSLRAGMTGRLVPGSLFAAAP